MASAPAYLHIPHSRWNEIPEDALIACGYRILTRSEDAGADAFVKRRKSLFVFFQGHPEYEADTLLLEYRRDVGRFLRGEIDSYPSTPQGYFNDDAVDTLTAMRERALSDRRVELLADFPMASLAAKVRNTWRCGAVCLYRNWLRYLCGSKDRRMEARQHSSEPTQAKEANFMASQGVRARQPHETEPRATREIHGHQIG